MEKPCDPIEITHENIEAIYEHEQSEARKETAPERVARVVADWSGTVYFIGGHIFLFAMWITANMTIADFDPFPFVLLITIVSLESILLSGFLLLSQNQMAKEADRRHKLDLQINLLAERESTALLRLVEKIAEKLDVPKEDRVEAQGLSDDTNPTDVLEQIVDVEKRS